MTLSKRIGQLAIGVALSAILIGASGAGQAAAASKHNTDVGVGIQQSATSADGTLNYVVTAVNDGTDLAKKTTITVPFDAAALRVVNWSLSKTASQVSAAPGVIEIQTGPLGGDGDSTQVTLSFQVLPGHAGAALTERASYRWSADGDTGSGVSNLPVAGNAPLDVQIAGGNATISGSVFGTNEPVTFWYNAPDGRVVGTRVRDGYLLDADVVAAKKAYNDRKLKHGVYNDGVPNVFADAQGNVSIQLSTADLAPGAYTVVAHGNSSGLEAVGAFEVK
jgi:hypothetical protein